MNEKQESKRLVTDGHVIFKEQKMTRENMIIVHLVCKKCGAHNTAEIEKNNPFDSPFVYCQKCEHLFSWADIEEAWDK